MRHSDDTLLRGMAVSRSKKCGKKLEDFFEILWYTGINEVVQSGPGRTQATFCVGEEVAQMPELVNEKHERFCQAYLIELNYTEAAKSAGYSERSAASQGSALMKKPEILARVRELRKERMERMGLDADFVLHELIDTYLKCKNPTPVLTRNPITGKYEQRGVYQFDSKGALKALEQIEKHLNTRGLSDPDKSNLLQMLISGTGDDINIDDLPEIQ